MPNSSVAVTDHGVVVLEMIKDPSFKEEILKELVGYYESVYDEGLKRFVMVGTEVEEHPHAIWWTYKDVLTNFPFGNPDPEVIGFLYQNRKYMKKLSINKLINAVIDYIKSEIFLDASIHQIISVAHFYKRVDMDVQNLIRDRLITVIDKEIEKDLGKWNEYVFEPYKVYIIAPELCVNQTVNLQNNLTVLLDRVRTLSVKIPWQWYRDEEVFEEVKNDWLGYLYFQMIMALRLYRNK